MERAKKRHRHPQDQTEPSMDDKPEADQNVNIGNNGGRRKSLARMLIEAARNNPDLINSAPQDNSDSNTTSQCYDNPAFDSTDHR